MTDTIEYEEVAPSTNLVESVRNFGYDFNTAISDLIDNSITAGSSIISIMLSLENGEPIILVQDDGCGMTETQLSENIVLGSKDPTEERQTGDLGRFGLGLKTASFSMCRQLNVFSRSEGHQLAFRSWDLDVIKKHNRWLVSKTLPTWFESLDQRHKLPHTGTLVIWKKCDRLNSLFATEAKMNEIGADLQAHIATFFSRFLSGRNKVKITVNDNQIQPWDPVPDGSVSLGEQVLGNIKIQPYVLPQRDAFHDLTKFEAASGIKGWNAQQGFYVFRNDRLIVNGGWLNLKRMKADEHTKLARIIVDFNSSEDELWNVDVSKSKASLPEGGLKELVDGIARQTRKRAEEVYRHRGQSGSRATFAPDNYIWRTTRTSDKKTKYIINRDHEVIQLVFSKYQGPRKDIERLLVLLERLLPKEGIQIAANSDALDRDELNFEDLIALAEECVERQILIGKTKLRSVNDLIIEEPFSSYRDEFKRHFNVD